MSEDPGPLKHRSGQARGRADVGDRIARIAGLAVARISLIGSSHGARHYRAELADGRVAFVKEADGTRGPAAWGALDAEARGLVWLADAGAVRVPDIIASADGLLAVTWLPEGSAGTAAAEDFGRQLARLHRAGAANFGAPWPGFIASLDLPSEQANSWPGWYAKNRILPYARLAQDNGSLPGADVRLIEAVADRIGELAGLDEPPSRIHGDLWSGNVLWSGGQGWVIDPAAHGGHRETDLAMLMLFGAPYLERILAAYREEFPLAPGFQARVPLHQLHPLLVHVCLFGGSYRESAMAAARAALKLAHVTLGG